MTNWQTCKLEELCTKVTSGGTPLRSRTEFYADGNIPWLKTKEVANCRVYDAENKITKIGLEKSSAKLIPANSVIVAMYGDGETAGRVAINKVPLTTNQACCNLIIDSSKANYEFIFYYLLNSYEYLVNLKSGSGQQNLSGAIIKKVEVVLPNIPTQIRIAEILSALDDKIELNRRMNGTIEQMAQTLFDKYSEPEETIPLSNLIELNPKLAIKKGNVSSYVEMKDLSESSASIGKSVPREFKSGSKFQNGDTLLARITPCLENGKTGFVDLLEEEEIGWGSTEFIVMRAKEKISPYFVYCLARDKAFRDYAMKSMVGTSGRQRVQAEMLNSFATPKWSKENMEAFHSFAHDAFQKIKANSKEITTLTKTRDTLLPKLMSGEIDVMQAQKAYEPVLS